MVAVVVIVVVVLIGGGGGEGGGWRNGRESEVDPVKPIYIVLLKIVGLFFHFGCKNRVSFTENPGGKKNKVSVARR